VEPYLAVAWSSGATPVVVLTKADLCDDVAAAVELVAGDAPGVDVLAVSAYTGEGRGRHATTAGRRHALPGGGRLVDTPGMREPGCAVAEAVDDGRLDPARSVAWRTRRT
jgi:ribosome biogenesis GTPase